MRERERKKEREREKKEKEREREKEKRLRRVRREKEESSWPHPTPTTYPVLVGFIGIEICQRASSGFLLPPSVCLRWLCHSRFREPCSPWI